MRWQKKTRKKRVQRFKYLVSDLKEYWGRGDGKNYKEDQALRPFKISYSDEVGNRFFLLTHNNLIFLSITTISEIFMNIY